jgi:hypothetical protein
MEMKMRKFYLVFFIGLLFFSLGFTNQPLPMEGVYNIKLRTLTFLDLLSKDTPLLSMLAELTESKPKNLNVQVDLAKMTEPTFGSLELGNNEKKTWFLMGKDEQGFWTEIYIDQNADQSITPGEKVKSLQTYQKKEKQNKVNGSYTMIPVPVRVSYKGFNSEFEKKIYFFLFADMYIKKGETMSVVGVSNASFLDGEIKVALGANTMIMRFRIYDIDGNGCYNDYGKDMIYLDNNYDGYYKLKEGQKLTEFYDVSGADEKKSKQYRLIVLPQPVKIAVVDAFKEFDWLQLESAVSDPIEEPAKTEKVEKSAKL